MGKNTEYLVQLWTPDNGAAKLIKFTTIYLCQIFLKINKKNKKTDKRLRKNVLVLLFIL